MHCIEYMHSTVSSSSVPGYGACEHRGSKRHADWLESDENAMRRFDWSCGRWCTSAQHSSRAWSAHPQVPTATLLHPRTHILTLCLNAVGSEAVQAQTYAASKLIRKSKSKPAHVLLKLLADTVSVHDLVSGSDGVFNKTADVAVPLGKVQAVVPIHEGQIVKQHLVALVAVDDNTARTAADAIFHWYVIACVIVLNFWPFLLAVNVFRDNNSSSRIF